MSRMPLVSVIITTYRRSNYLLRAVLSVLNQTYENLEIIIVDDNNGDDQFRQITKELLAEFISKGNIQYIEHEKNKGVATARNTGITASKGNFVAFLDDDDEWHKEKIAKQLELFATLPEDYGVISCFWNVIDQTLNKEYLHKIKYRADLSKILALNHFSPPSNVIIKKEYLEKVNGFDQNFLWREDVELYYRLSFVCKFDFVEEALVNYYKHDDAKSSNVTKKLLAVEDFICKHKVTLKANSLPWSEINERLGELYMLNGKRAKAIKPFMLAYMSRFSEPRILVKLVLSLFSPNLYMFLKKGK